MESPATIDEYIAAQPAQAQPLLQAVRDTIRAAAPQAQEKISYQMPTFWQGENIVHFAAYKNHLGFFPGGEAVGVFADRLTGYKTSKGTIQFPYSKPVDHALIADIVRWRAARAGEGKPTFAGPAARERHAMPNFIAAALTQGGLWERYRARPLYQQNDYVGWITQARRGETRQKRLVRMLEELRAGDAYMGMAYHGKG